MAAPDPALARLVDQVLSARHGQGALEIRGGGSKAFYGNPPRGEPLDVRPLAGISRYEPSELVVTVRAGTPLAELQAVLAERGQCLPFDPPAFGPGGTVGGMVAAGLSGPARAGVGSVRDYVLGATLLDGQGRVLSFGGQVMKNVAGYDVSRFLAGSLGILGVLCEVSLKVLSAAPAAATLAFDFDEAAALKQLAQWGRQPLPLNAGAWHDGRLVVRLAGARAAVAAAAARLGGAPMPPEVADDFWVGLRDHTQPFFGAGGGMPLWRLGVPAVHGPLVLPGERFIEWGGAQRWWRTDAAPAQVREAAAAAGGHATLFRGGDRSAGVFTPLPEAAMRIHRGLKQAFDPARVFNPGRLYPDL